MGPPINAFGKNKCIWKARDKDGENRIFDEVTRNPKRTVCKQIFNFTVFYPDDSSSGAHCLSLDNYNIDVDNDSPNHTWLRIELSNP